MQKYGATDNVVLIIKFFINPSTVVFNCLTLQENKLQYISCYARTNINTNFKLRTLLQYLP